jgi:hypothetical protein
MADARLDLAFAIGITDATGQRDGGVVLEDIAIKRVESGIVDVGGEDAFAEVIEHDGAGDAAQAAEGFLVQLSPDPGTGLEGQQADGFAAEAEGENEQAGASVVTGVRVPHHGAGAVIDLSFFSGRRVDDTTGFRGPSRLQLTDEALDALIASGKTMSIDHVLPNSFGVATLG